MKFKKQMELYDRIEELTKGLKEAIEWLERTEDGTDEQIRRIFGQETVDMLNRHRKLVDPYLFETAFPWTKETQPRRPT
jgi:hypothetical protein